VGTKAVLKAIKLEDMVATEDLEVTAATIVAVGAQTTDNTRSDTQSIISVQHSIETVPIYWRSYLIAFLKCSDFIGNRGKCGVCNFARNGNCIMTRAVFCFVLHLLSHSHFSFP